MISISSAGLIKPRTLPSPSSLSGRAGLAFERKIGRHLISDLSIDRANPYGISTDFQCENLDFTEKSSKINLVVESNSKLNQNQFQVIKNPYFYHNPWFKYKIKNQNSFKYCCPDFLIFLSDCEDFLQSKNIFTLGLQENAKFFQNQNLNLPGIGPEKDQNKNNTNLNAKILRLKNPIIIIIEIKLTYTDEAYNKLQNLYIPVIEYVYPDAKILPLIIVKHKILDSPIAGFTIIESLNLPIPLMQWLGHGKLRLL